MNCDAEGKAVTIQGKGVLELARTSDRIVRQGTLRDRVYQKLRDDIRTGAFDAGSRLVEVELAELRESSSEMKARWQAEQSILSSALHAVIARPAFISGEDREEDRLGERLGAVVSDTILKGLGALGAKKLEKTYRSMDADELATALLDLAEASVAQRQDATTPNHRIVEAYDLKR